MNLEIVLYSLLFILIGLTLVSFFLVWQWFDANERLKVVREVTREQTMHAVRHAHNKCRILLIVGLLLAIAYIPIPFMLGDFYTTLVYPGVVIMADMLILLNLRIRRKRFLDSLDDYVNANEEHVREAAAERNRIREQWRRDAPELNKQAQAVIDETFGGNYDMWFQHDILSGRHVLANKELGLLYAQGIVIPFAEIMEVRRGRKDLKLVTSNSNYPFITIDFGALPINPETGNKYMDEIAEKIEQLIP